MPVSGIEHAESSAVLAGWVVAYAIPGVIIQRSTGLKRKKKWEVNKMVDSRITAGIISMIVIESTPCTKKKKDLRMCSIR
jgi:hypothetical protein